MKKALLTLALAAVACASASAHDTRMDSLIAARRHADRITSLRGRNVTMNPYYCRLIGTPTLYGSTIQRMMQLDWQPEQQQRNEPLVASLGREIDYQLARVYVNAPQLITSTEQDMAAQPAFRTEVVEPLATEVSLTDKAVPVELAPQDAEPVEATAVKPKFWTLKGDGSVQLTQSYYSENWYQGGDNNFAELTSLTFQANFDNKKKLTWDNKLELQLGLQTANDTEHNIKATSNLIRITSSFGYEAVKHWYYTASLLDYTQIMKNYQSNSQLYSSKFGSPNYLTISVGMTYKFNSKKSKFSGSLLLAPIAYNLRYVGTTAMYSDSQSLRSYHGVGEKSGTFNNFGPSVTLNYKWLICDNVTWESRLYYYTNLNYVDAEWENTFSFTINKYLSTKLFLYPRFDDSSSSYKKENGSYWMFKEWLSFGLSFSF